jgi:histidine ammonia-lyase
VGSKAFSLGEDRLTPGRLVELASSSNPQITVARKTWDRLESFRQIVDTAIEENKTIYGINTGFGFLSDVKIDNAKLGQLQLNLVRSHACGVGDPIPTEQVRALLILRAHTFLIGHSGVTRATVEKILEFLSHDILPIVPSQGSVGASGDLAPLAHLAMGLIGEGDVAYEGEVQPAKEVLKRLKIKTLVLQPKEGLSLINGTQFMATIASFAVEQAKTLARSSDIFAAMSLDAIRGTLRAFDDRIHILRKQAGQSIVATNIRRLFEGGDSILKSHADCNKVQDPYSFRCVPQVHGATRDAIRYVADIVERELNSVTDNPLVFEGGDVISGLTLTIIKVRPTPTTRPPKLAASPSAG